MQQLNPEQKQQLKKWERKFQWSLFITLAWLFFGGLLIVSLEEIVGEVAITIVKVVITLVLVVITHIIYFQGKCPLCGARIGDYWRARIIKLPKQCRKCRAELK